LIVCFECSKDRDTYKAVDFHAFLNMTWYCGGYGFNVVGVRPEGRDSVNCRVKERRSVRACVGDGIFSDDEKVMAEVLFRLVGKGRGDEAR
jgi:hypothetical protein